MNASLPPEFSQLEHVVREWATDDGHKCYEKRANSPVDEIQALYDEVFLRAEESGAYMIDEFDYAEPLHEDLANLRNVPYSLITVSLAVKVCKQPRLKHSANTILTGVS